MMAGLSLRERRLVAVGLLVAALALAWLLVAAPLIDGFAARAAARDELLLRYARNARIIAQLPSVRRAAEQQRRTQSRFILVAPTPIAAADSLKERLAATVGASGGALRSVEDLAGTTPGQMRVRLDARLSPRQLSTVLTRLETEAPLLLFDSLTVSADQAFATSRAGPMDVRLEITAAIPAPAPR